jgi:hypothetical protein
MENMGILISKAPTKKILNPYVPIATIEDGFKQLVKGMGHWINQSEFQQLKE